MKGSSDIETDYAFSLFLLEKELGVDITPDYPVSKFLVQMEMLKKFYDEQKKQEGIPSKDLKTFR